MVRRLQVELSSLLSSLCGVSGWLVVVLVKMIPPNTTLLKYDNPLLITKNTDKKTPAVSEREQQRKTILFILELQQQQHEYEGRSGSFAIHCDIIK